VVHRLTGTLVDPRSARGLAAHGLAAAMVGRSDELEQLLGAFDRMQRGRAQVVSLVGEAGAGKSRLIAEFLGRLEADGRLAGTAVRRTGCSSLGQPTYGTFAAIFREGYQVDAGDSLDIARRKLASGLEALGAGTEEAQAIAPVLSYMLGVEEAHPRDLEPEQLNRQIALAARTLIERRLQQGPLLIIVEDLHWADAASVDLLRDVVDRLADRPVMVLLSHRPDARPPLVARAAQSVIRLAQLSSEEIHTLVRRLFGRVEGDASAKLPEFIAARAGGNPMFVEEIVRSLVTRGILMRRGEAWVCAAACEEVDVPATLHGLLLSRVDRLQPDERRLLQEVSALGVEFDAALLRAVASDGQAAEAALDRLVELDLLQQVGDGG
jgi:adenylate cyclase